jgi:hypothetical protein
VINKGNKHRLPSLLPSAFSLAKNIQSSNQPISDMNIPEEQYKEIESAIKSDESVVGIDAKKTHIIIIHMLGRILERLESLEERIDQLDD